MNKKGRATRAGQVYRQAGAVATSVKTADGRTVRWQNNGGKVPLVIREDMDVPEEYLVQPPPVPDSERIRQALLDGQALEFAKFGEVGKHVRIA